MEKRLILAIFLSFLILFLYQLLFIKPNKPAQPVPQQTAAVEKEAPGQVPEKPGEMSSAPVTPEASAPAEVVAAEQEETITVDTPLYEATWSNRGAVLKSWKLKKHLKKLPGRQDPRPEPLDLVPESAAQLGVYPLALKLDDQELADRVNGALYKFDVGHLKLGPGETASLIFEYSDGNTVKIRKQFSFNGQDYTFGIKISLEVAGKELDPVILWGPGIGSPSPEELKQKFSASRGAAFLTNRDRKVLRLQERKITLENEAVRYSGLDWAAYEENYFAAIFLMDPASSQAMVFKKERSEEQPDGKIAVIPYFYLAVSHPREAFLGPKDYDRLKAYGHQAKKIVNFGFFGGIAELLLVATKYFHDQVGNWGLAIIIMTLIIKIIFFPLTYSSTKSMARMAEIQPKIKALRAKYKRAKQDMEQRRQMNEELMRLYKEHGINPAGGCLPLLIQIPVFWGFFRMLVVAVEFRHSPFVFWIKDLSVKDPYYVTPILMGVTQFISQKMTPSTADPAQQKMMLLMPFIFTIFFMNFQAGLVLYWLTNNVLQIAQQAIMNRMMARKRESDGKRRKK
ncbi:MAG: Inner membrane protein translocase component YidC, long form [Candidatus Saccharicenans subterraneus]|uniref:Membrane protein insertase YidC n=1 Tax=Candidatus Saccharicenans subterraneus TaxID=2508984 RepID=A0A3E2BQ35_9BACT|nr:MAG: Inner membrane protein translocase component YidC, long form [Candidatus Saccharicenans subterraneum]